IRGRQRATATRHGASDGTTTVEHPIDGWWTGDSVVNERIQLIFVRQSPIAIAGEPARPAHAGTICTTVSRAVDRLVVIAAVAEVAHERKRIGPRVICQVVMQDTRAVALLLPHQAGIAVGDGAVSIVDIRPR